MEYFELDMTQEERLASIFKRIDKELSPFATQSAKTVIFLALIRMNSMRQFLISVS